VLNCAAATHAIIAIAVTILYFTAYTAYTAAAAASKRPDELSYSIEQKQRSAQQHH
jgi:hypothetical protein